MPKIRTESLKRLAKTLPDSASIYIGALNESAEYIAELESEVFDYKQVLETIAYNNQLDVSDTARHIARKVLLKYQG